MDEGWGQDEQRVGPGWAKVGARMGKGWGQDGHGVEQDGQGAEPRTGQKLVCSSLTFPL